jgi:hypothetical protein
VTARRLLLHVTGVALVLWAFVFALSVLGWLAFPWAVAAVVVLILVALLLLLG